MAGIVAGVLVVPARAQVEEGDSLRNAIRKYLESVEPVGEDGMPVTDEVVRLHEERLGEAARLDPRVVFAKMVVALRREQLLAANRSFAALPLDFRRSPLVLRVKIWLSIKAEDDINAQREMVYLIHYAKENGGEEQSKRAAEFVGKMFGYLVGPAGRPQKGFEKDMLGRIAPDCQPSFTAGRTSVAERFAAIEVELLAEREKAKAAEREQREQELALIAAKLATLKKQLDPMLARLQQTESELARDLKVDKAQLRLLARQLLDLERESGTLEKRYERLKSRADELREAAEQEPDLTKRQLLLSEATRFEDRALQLKTELTKQDTRRTAIVNQQRAARASIEKVESSLEPQRQAVEELHERARVLRDRERKCRTEPILGLSPKVAALERQARALETYMPEFWATTKIEIMKAFD